MLLYMCYFFLNNLSDLFGDGLVGLSATSRLLAGGRPVGGQLVRGLRGATSECGVEHPHGRGL